MGVCQPTHAQTSLENTAVLRAAILNVLDALRRSELPPGPVLVDERVLIPYEYSIPGRTERTTAYRLGPPRAPETNEALLRAIPATKGEYDTAVSCRIQGRPETCVVQDAVIVFAVSDPAILPGAMEVVVQARWMTSETRQPVHTGRFSVILVREPGGWQVRSRRILFIT